MGSAIQIQFRRFIGTGMKHILTFLTFCGFETNLFEFKTKNSSPSDLYNLILWNEFELSEPYAFADMYQFWCQKT